METGAEQIALGAPALCDLEFASALVESVSHSTIISWVRVFDCIDESLSWQLALPPLAGEFLLFLRLE